MGVRRRYAMISLKVTIALSMIGVVMSTFGIGAYVSSHPGEPVAQQAEVEVTRLPLQTQFEFARPTSIEAARSTEAKVLMLEPVLVYGRTSARSGPSSDAERD
jgi:hypothetical protein